MKHAVYPLSADPIHYGHIANLSVALETGLFDKIYVALGNNASKEYLFNSEERVFLVRQTIASSGLPADKIIVESFSGLLRNYAALRGIDVVIRGYRNGFDSDYEAMLADFNGRYGLHTFLIPANSAWRTISSSLLRSIVCESGFIHEYVHPVVKQMLEKKLRGLSLVGVTGNRGVGKTTLCSKIIRSNKHVTSISHINLDLLVKALYHGIAPLNRTVQKKVKEVLGEELFENGIFNAKKCAKLVFSNAEKRSQLAEVLRNPVIIELEEMLKAREGIVLIEAAYFVEYDMLPIVNYNVLLVECNENEQLRRIVQEKNKTHEEAVSCLTAQLDQNTKKQRILALQKAINHGFFLCVDTTNEVNVDEVVVALQDYFALSFDLGSDLSV